MRRASMCGALLVNLLIFLSSVTGTIAHAETLRIGIEGTYPPFSETDAKGHIVGFDADIAAALCTQMKISCKVVKQNWEKAIPDLNGGKIDALISSMSITEERLKVVNFTRPYYNSPVRFVIRRDAPISVDPPAKLSGLTIAVEADSIYEDYVKAVYVPVGAKILIVHNGIEEVWKSLLSRKADATPNDVVANAEFLKSAAGKEFIETGPMITDRRHLGAGAAIAVAKKNMPLAARFDAALLAIYKSGEYTRLRNRYFNFDIWAQ